MPPLGQPIMDGEDQDIIVEEEEGEIEDSDPAPLTSLPWVLDDATGELQHFLAEEIEN